MTTLPIITKASLTECAKRLVASEPLSKAKISITVLRLTLYYRIWFKVKYSNDWTMKDEAKLLYCDVFEDSEEETVKGAIYGVIDEIIKLINYV